MIQATGIFSAANAPLLDLATDLPNMAETIVGWFRPLTLVRINREVIDGEVVQGEKELSCRGVIQPFGPRELRLKPEGERKWKWNMLHTTPDVSLTDGEVFRVKGVPYRVMALSPYQEYGYIMYELVENYGRATNG